jgi:phosphohistidine phosphatase
MQLLVIRHAIAEDRDRFAQTGKDDDLRPLTAEGRRKMARNVRGLRRLVPALDLLAASPLVRAQQTARIVAERYRMANIVTTGSLSPGARFASFVEWALEQNELEVVGIVGHETHLSTLVTWLMTGGDESRLVLRKGGACLLDFRGRVRRASGSLLWLNTPAQLRQLGRVGGI